MFGWLKGERNYKIRQQQRREERARILKEWDDDIKERVALSDPLYDLVLRTVDVDIAETFRSFTPGRYDIKDPLLIHIARHLGLLCTYLDEKVGNTDDRKCTCGDGDDKGQPSV